MKKSIQFVLRLLSVLFVVSQYFVGTRLVELLDFWSFNSLEAVLWSFLLIATASSIATYYTKNKSVGVFFGKLGSYCFGFSAVTVFVLLLFEGINSLCMRITSHPLFGFRGIWLSVAIVIDFSLFIFMVWRGSQITTTSYAIEGKSDNLKSALKVVLISDCHFGYVNGWKRLKKIVEKINSETPDIILIAGDFFDDNYYAINHPEKVLSELNQLKGKYGSYISWGNHDAGETFSQMKKLIEKSTCHLLEEEFIEIEGVCRILGRLDWHPIGTQGGGKRRHTDQLVQSIPKDLPLLVLEHQPVRLDEYPKSVELIVSGHTHDGQVAPFNLVTRYLFSVAYGRYQTSKGVEVVVSSGVGTWGPPIRLGTLSEIVKIELYPK